MKINLAEIDRENFMVHPHTIAGEVCYLVQPQHAGAKWRRDNLHFRSSVWNSDGELISASFKKFFNWDEQPDLAYKPFSLTANGGCQLIEKIDGSTLIVSKYKGHLIVRTRGTVDATKLDNGYEIEVLKNKYPEAFKMILPFNSKEETSNYSLIYEWTSPVNKIVLNYGEEPEIRLIGEIMHADYSLVPQNLLDKYAFGIGVKRPQTFQFNSIKEMIEAVEALKGQEGICCYCNDGQDIRKIKSLEYLYLHRMKAELGSFDRVVDLWFLAGKLSYQDFETYIQSKFDYEVFSMCRGDVSNICDGWKEVLKIVSYMKGFVDSLNGLNRKESALKILSAYGDTNRASFVFSLLSGKDLNDEQLKKLLYQVLKK